ncbi:thiol protease/hemagglutinin PrtT [Bacteroides sp.]
MRKYYAFLLFLSFFFQNLNAKQITPEEALGLANRFWASANSDRGSNTRATSSVLTLVYTSVASADGKNTRTVSGSEVVTYYVFNADNNGGFVIVAADDRARSILAYSLTGSFGLENQPLQIRQWLSVYDAEIARLSDVTSVREVGSAASPYANDITAHAAVASVVEPLLGNIAWNQDTPFNDECPFDKNYSMIAPVGCVATAAAQIMKYYNYPVKGKGSKTYTCQTLNKRLSVDFGNTTYDWANMLDDYNGEYNEAQASAAAILSYHIGVSCNMDYSVEGSGATAKDIATGFKNYFSYDKNLEYVERTHFNESDWSDFLKAELSEKRPILYFGEGPSGGHAFVCDGYDVNGFFHFNWGWGGISNGYYQISALEPQDLGIGSGMGAYNHYQGILIGIQPPNEASTHLARVQLNGTFDIEEDETTRTGANKATIGFFNYGLQSFTGEVILGLYKDETLLATLASTTVTKLTPLGGGTKGFTFDEFSIPSSIENGTYRLLVAQKENGAADYTIMLTPVNYPNYYIVEVTDNKVSYVKPEFAPLLSLVKKPEIISTKLYKGRKATFRVTVKNDGEEFYSYMGILLQEKRTDQNQDKEKERQYVGMFPTRVPKGATRTFEYSTDALEVTPGDYDVVAVCDVDNAWSQRWWDAIGPDEFRIAEATVLAEPADPDYKLQSLVKVTAPDGSKNIYPNSNIVVSAKIKNTGGYGDGSFALLFFNDQNQGVGNSNIFELSLDQNETKEIKITHKLTYPTGQYGVLLASVEGLNAYPLLPQIFNRTVFRIIQGTGVEETVAGTSVFSCYEDQEILYFRADCEIRSVKMIDISGRVVRSVSMVDCEAGIQISGLPSGLYVIQAETEQGTRRCKLMKK